MDVEERLRVIWKEVLGCDVIDVSSTLSQHGGDSIAAMLCANRIRREFNVVIRPGKLVSPDMTFALLADLIESQKHHTATNA